MPVWPRRPAILHHREPRGGNPPLVFRSKPPNCCNRASRCAKYRYPVICGKYLFVRCPVVGVENVIASPAHTHGFSTVNYVTQRIDEHMILGHHFGEPVRIVLVKVLEKAKNVVLLNSRGRLICVPRLSRHHGCSERHASQGGFHARTHYSMITISPPRGGRYTLKGRRRCQRDAFEWPLFYMRRRYGALPR